MVLDYYIIINCFSVQQNKWTKDIWTGDFWSTDGLPATCAYRAFIYYSYVLTYMEPVN